MSCSARFGTIKMDQRSSYPLKFTYVEKHNMDELKVPLLQNNFSKYIIWGTDEYFKNVFIL